MIAAVATAAWTGHNLGARRARARAARELERSQVELNRRLTELFALQELSYVLSESLRLERVVEQVAHFVERFVNGNGVLVALTSETGGIKVAAALGALADLLGREIPESQAGLIGVAMGRERLEVAESVEGRLPEVVAGVTAERVAVAPFRSHGVTVGAIAVASPASVAFRPEDLRLISTVATHTAVVLTNARLFDLVRAGKEQWETAFDALIEGLAVLDDTGHIRRANRALAEMGGRQVPAIIGLHIGDALIGHSAEVKAFLDAARRGDPQPPLTRQSEHSGRMLRFIAAPLRGAGDEGWVVVLVEDVTEQRAIESQLIQNEKMAAVGQLLSGVAHELNNPLTSIAGLSEFLLERPASHERERDHLKVIHEQAERAGRIVRNLLTFARKGPADIGDVDLADAAQRTILLIGYEARLREAVVETDFPRGLPPVRGDRYQIQQVVLNLITNAVQAVAGNPPDAPRRVSLSLALDRDYVTLRVADTGPGIPEALVSKIFDPFFTTKDPGEGTGLGLSISFRIVEGHGGKLSVQKGPDGGAVFSVSFPVSATSTVAAGPPEPAPAAQRPSGRRVLVVDDDPAVQRMLGTLLAHDGHRVQSARTGEDAMALLQQESYDLVIADPFTAVSPGETFASHLLEARPDMWDRAIFITGDVRQESDDRLRALGCRYFRKPFNLRELEAASWEILRTTGQQRIAE